ncbi:MAG: TonB-dependent receptor [Myxococcales bacterium]|nr:TonB-dependent receptor [Myxococcales bacterium]
MHFSREELRRRPHDQPSDLLRQTPGLVVAQHAGGGKSDQYFLRGFDADHGTDVAIFVDGVPANLTSHGHGQGYADTHWLIPETVDSVDVHKGPYAARYGDFYTAGAIEMKTAAVAPGTQVWLTGGGELAGPVAYERRPSYRLVGMGSPRLERGAALVAAEIGDSDGPFINPQAFRRGASLLKWTRPVGDGELHVAGTFYAARWNQSGQIPAAAVAAGRLDRFGASDPTEGGTSSRASLALGYALGEPAEGAWNVDAYLVDYRLRLFSNFTLFLRDPVAGDQIEQTDARAVVGTNVVYRRTHQTGALAGLLRVGAQSRADDVTTELWHTSQRQRLADCFANANPCNRAASRIRNLAVYAEEDLSVGVRVRVLAGLRLDQFTWDVDDLDPETQTTPATTGGTAQRAIVSPKLSVVARATDGVDVFVSGGLGFHSNDARAAVATDGRGALARASGAEAGVRVAPVRGLRASADLWYLYLSSEQVWSGDAGGTEPSDPTRRYGVDLDASWDATPWLAIDANLAIGRATFVANAGNGGALALAPRVMGGAGVTAHRGDSFVALRARGIGDRPANDDGSLTAEGYLLLDVVAEHRVRCWSFGLTINNLLDRDWREAQFADESRVSATAAVVEDVHFTPGMPLTALVTVGFRQ